MILPKIWKTWDMKGKKVRKMIHSDSIVDVSDFIHLSDWWRESEARRIEWELKRKRFEKVEKKNHLEKESKKAKKWSVKIGFSGVEENDRSMF